MYKGRVTASHLCVHIEIRLWIVSFTFKIYLRFLISSQHFTSETTYRHEPYLAFHMSVIANTLSLSVDANLPPEIGQPVHINTQKHIQRQINGIIGWNDTSIAPMTIPQTLLRSNLSHVGEQSYFVCEKSVGCRFVVHIT